MFVTTMSFEKVFEKLENLILPRRML